MGLLENFKKSSTAFTSTAVVLHESIRAHVRKRGIVSDEKNCIKAKKKFKLKLFDWIQQFTYKLEWCQRVRTTVNTAMPRSDKKILEKIPTAGQLEIWEPWLAVNLTQSVNIHGYILSPAKTER